MKPEEIEKQLNQKKAFQVEFGQKGTNLTYQDKQKLEKWTYQVLHYIQKLNAFIQMVILRLT